MQIINDSRRRSTTSPQKSLKVLIAGAVLCTLLVGCGADPPSFSLILDTDPQTGRTVLHCASNVLKCQQFIAKVCRNSGVRQIRR